MVGLWKVPVLATGRESERDQKSDQNRTQHRGSAGAARTQAGSLPKRLGPRARGDQPPRAPSGSDPPPASRARGRGGRALPEASLSIAPRRGDQIGRASGRERGEISGVAVSLKKKTKKRQRNMGRFRGADQVRPRPGRDRPRD